MPDTKISAFPAAAALGGTEAVPMVQSAADVKSTPADINTYVRSTMGTGVSTAISVNVGSAGSVVVNGGALGTPSSGTLTNATGLPAAGVVGTAATLAAANLFTTAQTITPLTDVTALTVRRNTAGTTLIEQWQTEANGPLGGIGNAGQIISGAASAATGAIVLYNSASANATTIQAGNAAAARTYIWPTNFGAAGTVLTDAAGNGTLSWAAGGGSGLTVGTSTITSGTGTRLLYETSGNVLGEISGVTSDGTKLTSTRVVTITQGTANEPILTCSGFSLTGSSTASAVSYSGTLNTTGIVDFYKVSATTTAFGTSGPTHSTLFNYLGGTAGNVSVFNYDLSVDAFLYGTVNTAANFYVGYRAQAGTQGLSCGFGDVGSVYIADSGYFAKSDKSFGFTAGALNATAIDTTFTRGGAGKFQINNPNAGTLGDISLRQLYPDFTNTSTVGAVTIDKSCGQCIVAASASSVVVTNALVTANSQILATIATNDTTAILKNVVAGTGSFTVTLTATATGNTKVNFLVLNQ